MSLQRIGTSVVFVLAMVIGLAQAHAQDANKGTTLDNLQSAYNGESNAAAEYEACAKKADAEGYQGVASLFRTAARSEQIHAGNHAAVIKKMGAQPKAEVKTPEVKTTKENLQEAIKDESHERDVMYPQFVQQARADDNPDAVRSFTYARNAEATHAKLFQTALDNLDQWKEPRQLYVCPTCGYTASELPGDTCPSCGQPTDKFEKIK